MPLNVDRFGICATDPAFLPLLDAQLKLTFLELHVGRLQFVPEFHGRSGNDDLLIETYSRTQEENTKSQITGIKVMATAIFSGQNLPLLLLICEELWPKLCGISLLVQILA